MQWLHAPAPAGGLAAAVARRLNWAVEPEACTLPEGVVDVVPSGRTASEPTTGVAVSGIDWVSEPLATLVDLEEEGGEGGLAVEMFEDW